jgi:hypothetical protein
MIWNERSRQNTRAAYGIKGRDFAGKKEEIRKEETKIRK